MTQTENKTILIVDDEISVSRSIREVLLGEGYGVEMAPGGQEALGLIREKFYDLIIVDLMMPGLNGVDLLRQIKTESPKSPVIMITGYPTMKSSLLAMQLGAFDFLPKPFLPNTLRQIVAKALEAPGKTPDDSGVSG